MIKIINGNILNASEHIIGHQVNCKGVMGAGLAKQIRNKYPEVYKRYVSFVKEFGNNASLLGMVQITRVDEDKFIANVFSQNSYGRTGLHTSYELLRIALEKLKLCAMGVNKSIALPYGIGCGLAGGDWSIVYKIIDEVFNGYEVTLYRL